MTEREPVHVRGIPGASVTSSEACPTCHGAGCYSTGVHGVDALGYPVPTVAMCSRCGGTGWL